MGDESMREARSTQRVRVLPDLHLASVSSSVVGELRVGQQSERNKKDRGRNENAR